VLPTAEQAIKAAVLCQWLSNGYQPISIFRFDDRLQTLYIQAGVTDEIAVVITNDGKWRFV
jgi:hypothetical protein